jgi:uncharacterized protein YbjT (DUF2867 family)
MSVLVVGGTGNVGGAIALALARQGQKISVMARGGANHPKAKQLVDAGVRVVEGDLWKHDALGSVVRGAETVVSTATAMPAPPPDGIRKTDHDGTLALIRAAEAEGVKRFVYCSYSGNIHDEESPLQTAKRECERQLGESSMETAILRPSYFMEVWLSPMLGFDPANGSARIYGSGEGKVSYISNSNVAEFMVAAVSAKLDAKHAVLELGGPEALSQLDVVRIFEQRTGQKFKIDYVPMEALQAQHQSSDPLQKTFGALTLAYAKGDAVVDAVQNAQRFQIRLRSVGEHASHFSTPAPVS